MKGKKFSASADSCHEAAANQQTPIHLTAKQSVVYLNISYSSFRRWRKDSAFPTPFRYRGVWRWRLSDLDAFVAAHIQKTEVL
jgi:predicted DNA-binding transcriptional regulator AlpA